MSRKCRRPRGFTIVELITVILLLGILSAVAVARGLKQGDFDSSRFVAAAEQQYRLAQSLSTGRFGDQVEFLITENSGTWNFVTRSTGSGEIRRESVETNALSLNVSNGGYSSVLNSGDSVSINFSTTGEISSAAHGSTDLGVNLGIGLEANGSSTHHLCIYPTGYIGSSPCE